MRKEIKQPNLRFKKIKGEWKQWKIGELITEKYRPILIEDEKEYQLVTVKRRNEGVVSRGYLKGKNILVKNYFELEKDDFIISKRQIIHGASGIVPQSLHKAVVSNEYLVAVSNENISTEYLTLISKLPDMYKQYFLSSFGVDVEKMVFDVRDWKKRSITIPEINEQKNITDFFQDLDKLITEHQQKHTKLKSLKQAMLDKMFPKQGQTVPEIRFKGFEGDWEEYNLSEIADIIGGGTPSTTISEYWNGDIDWYSPTEIGDKVYAKGSVKKITQLGLNSCSAKVLPAKRTILFTSRAGIGDVAILMKEGATNQGFQSLIVKTGFHPYFIYSNSHIIKKYALKNASGSTFLEISGKMLGKLKILVPALDEQKIIGNYFKNLDELIDKHETQITKLQNIKKALLAKMFI
jgi:type I restriction enzyme S subunit